MSKRKSVCLFICLCAFFLFPRPAFADCDDDSFAGDVLSGLYDQALSGMSSCFIDVSWSPGSYSTAYPEEYSSDAEGYTELLARFSAVSDEALSRQLLDYASGLFGFDESSTGNDPPARAEIPAYSMETPPAESSGQESAGAYFITGPDPAERISSLIMRALEYIDCPAEPFLSSAAFVCSCGISSGFSGTLEFPVTPVADELYSFLSAHSGSCSYYLKPLLGTGGDDVPCLSAFGGSIVFLRDGSDADFLEWMPGYDNPVYSQCGIITAAGPGFVEIATTDRDGNPRVERLDRLSCPDSAALLRFSCRGYSEIVTEYLRRRLPYNDAVIAGIAANICMESGFDPEASGDGGSSYGLCQWHSDRFDSLKDFCLSTDSNVDDFRAQVSFLEYEMREYYPELDSLFLETEDSAGGARMSAERFCLIFECPLNAYAKSRLRSDLAAEWFYPAISASG